MVLINGFIFALIKIDYILILGLFWSSYPFLMFIISEGVWQTNHTPLPKKRASPLREQTKWVFILLT